jgi:hypothetical protein
MGNKRIAILDLVGLVDHQDDRPVFRQQATTALSLAS